MQVKRLNTHLLPLKHGNKYRDLHLPNIIVWRELAEEFTKEVNSTNQFYNLLKKNLWQCNFFLNINSLKN